MKPSELEAHQLLFTGQYNVAVMANQLEVSLSDLQFSFKAYCKKHPAGDYALLDQAIDERRDRVDAQKGAKGSQKT